jgi:hypothetical protein
MKKKILISIIVLVCVCILVGITFFAFRKKAENNSAQNATSDTVSKNESKSTNNSEKSNKNTGDEKFKLRSYTSSKTFYITGPEGYTYNDERTGIMNSTAEFRKGNSRLIYSFEEEEISKYVENKKKSTYERRQGLNYCKDLIWQDAKTITVNNNEVTYVKVTYNDGSKYHNEIYSISKSSGWLISCEITQSSDSDNFEEDGQILKEAWGISFTTEK